MTSGYQPLGGVILHERVYRALVDAGPEFTLHHGYTYSGHPVACAAGLANLDIIEREDLIARRAPQGAVLQAADGQPGHAADRRRGARRRAHGRGRAGAGQGGARAVPGGRSRWRRASAQAALRRGVILRPGADLIVVCPPLIVTREQIDVIVRVLGEAIAEVAAEVSGR